jgi:hypothetical protein
MGRIAGILLMQGKLEEALRIRTDEQLPIFEAIPAFQLLNDAHTCACLFGKIGQALFARGASEEALCTFRYQALPIFEQLGDAASILLVRYDIAWILIARAAPNDLLEAQTLLSTALQDAKRMDLAIQDEIAETLRDLQAQLAAKN